MSSHDITTKLYIPDRNDFKENLFLPAAGDISSQIKFFADEVVDYENPIASTSGTVYITDILDDGVYYFVVKAVDDAGNLSEAACKKLIVNGAPQPVFSLNYSFKPGPKIYLYWQPSRADNLYTYNIYSNNGSGEIDYSQIYDSTDQTFWTSDILSSGIWKFNVRCMDASGLEETNFHNEITVNITSGISYPEPPSNLRAYAISNGKIKLVWNESSSSDAAKYNIYYDNGSGTIDYSKKIASVNHTNYFGGLSEVSYITLPLVNGVTYKFGVRTENIAGTEEKNTDIVASATADTQAPSRVSTIQAQDLLGGR